MIPKIGDRVRIVGAMINDPRPMEIGTEGTVAGIGPTLMVFQGTTQIDVVWDNRRRLILLSCDPFIIV